MNRAVGTLPLRVGSSINSSIISSSNILVNGLVKRSFSTSTKKTGDVDNTTTTTTKKNTKKTATSATATGDNASTTTATGTTTAAAPKQNKKYVNKSSSSTPPPPPPSSSTTTPPPPPSNNGHGKRPPLFKPVTDAGQSEMRFGRLHVAGEDNNNTTAQDNKQGKKSDDDETLTDENGNPIDPITALGEYYEIKDELYEYFDLGSQPTTSEQLEKALEESDKKYGFDPATAKPYVPQTPADMVSNVLENFSEALNQDLIDAASKTSFENPLQDYEDTMSVKSYPKARKGETVDDVLDKVIFDKKKDSEGEFVDEEYEQVRPESNYDHFEADRQKNNANKVQDTDKQLPYHRQSKEIESNLRMHLNKFLIKVHPDLFHNEPEKHSTNQKSLTTLNNLLRTRDQYIAIAEGTTEETKVDRIPNTITIVFHHYTASGAQAIVEHEMNFEEASEQVATSKTALVEYVTELRFAVHRQLYDLFTKCDIPIPQIEIDQLVRPSSKTADNLLNDDPWDDYFGLNQKEGVFSLANTLDEFLSTNNVSERRKYSELTNEHEDLLQSFNEDKIFFYYGENVKGDINIMRQLGYREEAERQIIHLKKYLPALEFGTWSSLPIMITTPSYYDRLCKLTQGRGFVVLLKDFVPEKTLPYIKQQVPKIQDNFNQLYSVSKKNQELLQKATISLEKSLGASSVIIENLFSINQRTMNQVRDKFNKAQTMVAKLNIPMTKLIDSTKASKWITLPQTQLDGNVMDEWKVKNIEMNQGDKQKIVQKLNQVKLGIDTVPNDPDEQAILNENVERDMNRINSLTVTNDRLQRPLTIVDTNQFNYVQSAPFVSSAMSCIERLTKLVHQPVEVPMVLPEKMTDPDFLTKRDQYMQQKNNSEFQEEDDHERREYYQLIMGNAEMTVDKLSTRKSLAQIDSSQFSTSANVVSSFNVPLFGSESAKKNAGNNSDETGEEATADGHTNADGSLMISDQVKRFVSRLKNHSESGDLEGMETTKKNQVIKPKQRLTDFGWANIHLIISDHYQFIVSKEDDVAYVFVPMNFKESELFLFLNANYDKISLIQNIFYSPVLEKTQQMMQVQSIQSTISLIRSRVQFASIKIDNIAVADAQSQYAAVQLLKNTVYLSTDIQALQKIAPYVDIVIGASSRIVFKDSEKTQAVVVFSHLNRASMNLPKIISSLCEQSPFFKSLLPNFTYTPFESQTSPKEQQPSS